MRVGDCIRGLMISKVVHEFSNYIFINYSNEKGSSRSNDSPIILQVDRIKSRPAVAPEISTLAVNV